MRLDHPQTYRRLQINYERNCAQDYTAEIDRAVEQFRYADCQDQLWQAEPFSLLYGTALWDEASPSQRLILNHLYWVAYYSQIVSAEIAIIYFNQTSAAGLYGLEDFRLVCDMLDLETKQERSHIHAFRTIGRATELALLGQPMFTYPMRGPFTETMVYADTSWFKQRWKSLQLQSFGLLSANNPFLACQYFTVRGLRTLNGKLVQHRLSQSLAGNTAPEQRPIPAQVSYYHFMDDSFHFNSSTILAHDVVKALKPPTAFERQVMNLGIRGCQQDHYHFSAAINGIFWYDPALYSAVYRVLRSPSFGLDPAAAKTMMARCFTQESEGLHLSYQTHQEAIASYRAYLEKVGYLWTANRQLSWMAANSIPRYLRLQQRQFRQWCRQIADREVEAPTAPSLQPDGA
ncbi:MAG: P-aminobenzoate N-oxygenase AurF [Elainella sp.]